MDKQSSKKPFFIMPEWAWAIVVGMFMLLLFLNHVIPGHAAEINLPAGAPYPGVTLNAPGYPDLVYTDPFRSGLWIFSDYYYTDVNKTSSRDYYGSTDYGQRYTSVSEHSFWNKNVELISGFVRPHYSGIDYISVSSENYLGFVEDVPDLPQSFNWDYGPGKKLYAYNVIYYDSLNMTSNFGGYVIYIVDDDFVPTLYQTGIGNANNYFELDSFTDEVVDTCYFYFTQRLWNQISWERVPDSWYSGGSNILDALNDDYYLHLGTNKVFMGDFYFDHTQWYEVTLDYKSEIDIESRRFRTSEPEPTPEPEILSFVFSAGGSYYLVDTYASLALGYELSSTYEPFVFVRNKFSNFGDLPLLRPSIVYCSSSSSNISLYFPADSVSEVRIYNTGSSLVSDFAYVRENFSYTSLSSSGYYGDFEFFLQSSDQGSFNFYSVGIRRGNWSQDPSLSSAPGIAQYSFSSAPYNAFKGLDFSSSYSSYCPVVFGIELMVDLRTDPNLPEPSPTPGPTFTPAPLPTAGESVHVILPTGTPTPTPPFTVSFGPGGSGGDGSGGSGTGSGLSGDGLSPGVSSNVLQGFYYSLIGNPAFGFIAAAFQAIPDEVLYPLFALLFVLLVLAAIRLFIHFAGG